MLPMKNKEYGVVEELTTESLSLFRLSLKMLINNFDRDNIRDKNPSS
jgi:hypothetical protein